MFTHDFSYLNGCSAITHTREEVYIKLEQMFRDWFIGVIGEMDQHEGFEVSVQIKAKP